jgi:hypothetical protein
VLALQLPALVGTREAADDLLHECEVAPDLRGETVVLLCRDLLSGSPSFADQLVKRLLVEAGAEELILVAARARFVELVKASAARRRVLARVRCESAAELPV